MERLTTNNPQDNLENALNLFFAREGKTWVRNYGLGQNEDVSLDDLTREIAKTNGLEIAQSDDDQEISWEMADALYISDGTLDGETVVALFYTAAWVCAELRAHLMAYEDTGMTPEEVGRIKEYMQPFTIRDMDRFREIMTAEKNGQLVILPCKNDTVYTIEEDYFNCDECRHKNSAYYQKSIEKVSCDMRNGERCPFYIKEHKAEGFEITFDEIGTIRLSNPGEFGYEGLERFCGVDDKVYYTRKEAEAAIKKGVGRQ